MDNTLSKQQLACLSDFRATVEAAIDGLTRKMTQETSAIKNSGSDMQCRENFDRIAQHCEHLLHWCHAHGAVSRLELAKEEPDWDTLQPSDSPAGDEERDCAIHDYKRLIEITNTVLEEIIWLQSYFICPAGTIPARKVTHWFPDRRGIPEVRDETLYELVDLQDRVEGWEILDPECDALLQQYSALWQRIRSVAAATRPPPNNENTL